MHGSCFDEALHIAGFKERLRMVLLGFTEIAAAFVADETVGVSRATRRWYPWIREVVPNGVDLDRFHDSEDVERVPAILFVGTYRRRKRGWLLVDVFERGVRPRMPEARLWMVCSDAPERPGVEVLGQLSDDELAARYRQASVFCLPSTYEGFGVPYVEAMASGTPVVATPNPGAREVLEDGRLGFVVADHDLAAALLACLERSELSRMYAHRGLAHAARFSWSSVIDQYERIYYKLLDESR
jgi:glycosyltransferase involved in cell wall biosynthesis